MYTRYGSLPLRKELYKMKKVRVECSGCYDILVGRGLFADAGRLISEGFPRKRVCVISDETVAGLYLDALKDSLVKYGIKAESFIFCPGEKHKTMQTVEKILEFLAERHFTRSDMLIALGGGIVGDVTGFCAAIYQRGIKFVQIPTTVLAAVDSSVGGKTGVNLGGIKNQVGAFWQPSLVICDPNLFSSLDSSEYASGMAEVIKYAAICRPSLGEALDSDCDIEGIIAECVEIKRDIVQKDERDTGERQLLNLGHTFGHAVEKVTGNAYNHGQAVAVGTVMAFRAAEKLGTCPVGELKKLKRLCGRYGLPTTCDLAAEQLIAAMLNDKKRAGDKITLVLPRSFGNSVLYETDMDTLPEIVRKAVE